MPKITRDQAEAIVAAHAAGEQMTALADAWGVKRHAIYNALRRYKLQLQGREDHIALQQVSATPPELYAYRAGISYNSLRVKAHNRGERLAVTSNLERKAYWAKLLESFDGLNLRAFCRGADVPVVMTAYWYHRIEKPKQALLWGMAQVIEVDPEAFENAPKKHDPDALFAIGMGSRIRTLSPSAAGQIYRDNAPARP